MKSIITVLTFLVLIDAHGQKNLEETEPVQFTYKIVGKDSLQAYVFSPTSNTNRNKPAIVIFHGGGWSMGDPTWAFNRARRFALKGILAISVQYRLSDQKNISPIDAIEDAQDAMLWVRSNANKLQIYSDSIVAYGWSAGAHLAACTAVFPVFDTLNNTSSVPNAMVLYSPALSVIRDGWFNQLLPQNESALNYSPAENISGKMPPSIIVVGKTDTVTPVYESELFHQNMLKNDNKSLLKIYEGVGHLFTPSNQPDNGFPSPDKEVEAQANSDIDSFLKDLGFID